MKKKEIEEYINSKSITQDTYQAPQVISRVHDVPTLAAPTQTVQSTVKEPTVKTQDIKVQEPKKEKKKSGGNFLLDAAKTVGKTAGNIATNMGEGALKAGESILDFANDLSDRATGAIKYPIESLIRGKKQADKSRKEDAKATEEFIKRDLTKDFQNAVGYTDEEKKKWEEGSLVKSENFGGKMAQSIGGMVPALVAGQYAGFTPEMTSTKGLSGLAKAKAVAGNVAKTYASQLPSNAVLGASSYGGGMEEALNKGASRNQASLYGLANAGIEQGTEALTSGVPGLGGKGGIDQYLEPLINKNTNGYLNALLRYGYGALGEGLEEKAGTYLDALARQNILGEKINWKDVEKESNEAALLGATTGAILNAPEAVQNAKNVKIENDIINALGEDTYAEGDQQYNPEYKGWEKQRQLNEEERTQRRQASEERQKKIAEYNENLRKQQETQAQPQTTTVEPQISPVETQTQEVQQNIQETQNKPLENVKYPEINKDINKFEDIKDDYRKYYAKSDLENFNEEILSKAKEVVQANNQGKRTKQEWLDVAKNIGLQADNMPAEQLKQYAFESFKYAQPNQAQNLNRQGQKYVSFGVDEWVKNVYEGAGVGTELNKNLQSNREQEIDNLRQEIRQEETRVEQGTTDDGYHLTELQKELEDLESDKSTNLAEEMEEPVLKIETTGEKGKQYWKEQGTSDEVANVLSEMPKVDKEPIRERIKNGKAKLGEQWSYFKRNLVDKGETIYTLGKKTKNPNLYAKYDKRGTTTGEANYDIGVAQTDLQGKKYNNFIDKNGKRKAMSLNQIWDGVDNNLANEYLAHYLNVDRYNQTNQDGTQKYVFGESITDQDSLNKVRELEAKHPELKRFGENVWQYGRNQLQNMVDAGKISQAQADQFLKDTPHYVRLQRNVENKSTPLLEFDKKGNVKVNKNIKEFKGSTLDILPFKESMAQYTLDVRNGIRDNIFAQELAKTLGIGASGETVTDIDDIMGTNPELLKDNGDGTYSLTFFNKGTATTIPIDEGIYESLQPNKHYKFEDTLPFKGIRKFDNFRKALLTDKNPLFLATNMMKDAFDAPLNSKYPAQFVKNYPRAIKEIMTNGKYYQQYQALGGLQNTYFENKEFQKQGSKYNPMTWIEKGNNAVEQFPRLAEFISTMEKTGDVDQAMYNAAEITTNFKRGGDWTRAANRNGVTFLNASVQGFSKQVRNFTDIQNPKQAVQLLGKIVALGIAPALINDAMWDDDDEYKELQDYQKDNYYLFKGKDGTWIRIPKGRAVSVFQSAARRTKYALGGDDKAYQGFVDFAKNQVAPNSPFENNILSPITNVKENKSWSGNKIVNDSMSKRPEAEQFNEKTDEFSKWLGKKLNYSPMKINYLLDQYSGVIGDVGLPMITPRSSSKTSNPIIASAKDKFTLDAVNSNKSVGTFYDTKDEIEKQKNSLNSTPIDAAKNSYMTSQSIALSELYKKQKEIQNSNLSKKEKYEQAREVQKQINEFAKKTVNDVNNIEQEKYYLKIGNDYYKRVIKDGEEKYVKDTSKKRPTEKYALYDYFKEKYEKSKEEK